MSEPYFLSVTTPADRSAWEQAVAADPQAMIFQQPIWTNALTSLGSYQDASRQYTTRDGRVLVLPMVRHAALGGFYSSSASMPDGWGMGGIVSAQPFTEQDAAHILADLAGLPDQNVGVRVNPLQASRWDAVSAQGFTPIQRESHILNLEGGFETVWLKKFPSATRTKIRKAEKEGLEVITGHGGELLDVFYDVYLQWIDRRAVERKMPPMLARWSGKKREPLAKFKAAARVLGSAFQVWVVQLDAKPVATAILLLGQHQAVYWRSASLKEVAGPIRANELLQSRMIEVACQAGCRYYHMGESGGVESLKHFKSKFGAEPHPYRAFNRERLPINRARGIFDRFTRRVERQLIKEH